MKDSIRMVKLGVAFSIAAILLAMSSVVSLRAQTPPPDAAPLLSPDDLQQLVAPIALYPDPMIALILPASTVPTDIVLADRFVQDGGDPNDIDSQNWDESVKGLARYPDVLKMMDDNLDWTNQLGAAVLAQQGDVMTAIQAQRAKAYALGNLESNSQQQVIDDNGIIQIVPADPQVIYVPDYDPQVIYVDRGPSLISFGLGLAMGAWIGGDCDWHNHGIYQSGYYESGRGWRRPAVQINIFNSHHVWRPNPGKPRPRPPYRPNRPGHGAGHGQLPGWHRPPGGNRPSPGKPGRPGNVRPQPKPERPAHGNRPGVPGNRPDTGRPQIQPVPGGTRPGQTKPAPGAHKPGANRPEKPSPRPTPGADRQKPADKRPGHARPAPSQNRPAVRPETRPAQPKSRPAAPASRPAQSSKRLDRAPSAPAQAKRPAPAKAAPAKRPAAANRPAPRQCEQEGTTCGMSREVLRRAGGCSRSENR